MTMSSPLPYVTAMDEALDRLCSAWPDSAVREVRQPLSSEAFAQQKGRMLARGTWAGALAAVMSPEGRIPLTNRSRMHAGWALPGGTVEPGEEFDAALHRELREEVDVRLDDVQLELVERKVFVSPEGEELPFALAVFSCSMQELDLPPRTPDACAEGLQLALFPLDGLPDMVLGDAEKLALMAASLERRRKVLGVSQDGLRP